MATRNTRSSTSRGNTRPAASKTSTTRRQAAKPAPEKQGRDVTVYATKEPTDYHKAFATWIVKEVGYKPSEAASLKEAFLAGVSIATAARPAFMESDFLEDWRERNGVTKRGPKGNQADDDDQPEEKPTRIRGRRKPEPEPEPETDDDDDFEDDESDDDDFEDDDSDDSDDDSDDDDFEEPTPPKRQSSSRSSSAGKSNARGNSRQSSSKSSKSDDDDFLF